MIWVQHNVYSNFTNSVNSGDTELTLSIFKSELSDIIVYDINELFELFDKLGIKYSERNSDEQILKIVLEEINNNDKFIKGLAYLIANNNDSLNQNKDKSWVTILNGIGKAIKKISKEFTDNTSSRKVFENEILQMIELKATKVGDRERVVKKKSNTKAWIIGIALVGISAYLIYEYLKYKKEKDALTALSNPAMEVGGSVPPLSPVGTPELEVKQPVAVDPRSLDPAFNVSKDVLIPLEQPVQNPSTTVSVNVATPSNNVVNPIQSNSIQPAIKQ